MTYDAEKVKVSREAFQVVEIDLDRCIHSYAEDGTIVSTHANMLYDSAEFETSAKWAEENATVKELVAEDSDRRRRAARLVGDAVNNAHDVYQNINTQIEYDSTATVVSCAAEFKRGSNRYANLYFRNRRALGADYWFVLIDLDTGTAAGAFYNGSTYTALPTGGTTFTVTDKGDGWYEVKIENMADSAGTQNAIMALGLAKGLDNTGTGDWIYAASTQDFIFIAKARFNYGATVKQYVETGADPDTQSDGQYFVDRAILNNGCRLDKSNEFYNTSWLLAGGYWSVVGCGIFGWEIPDSAGYSDSAVRLRESAVTSNHDVHYDESGTGLIAAIVSGNIASFGCEFKDWGGRGYAHITVHDYSGTKNVAFINLTTGATGQVGFTGATISTVNKGNGWWLLKVENVDLKTYTVQAEVEFGAANGTTSGSDSYLGDITKGVYMARPQCNVGAALRRFGFNRLVEEYHFSNTDEPVLQGNLDHCYNTFWTCNSQPQYQSLAVTHRFCTAGARFPVGENLIPAVKKVQFRSPKVDPVKTIGVRGAATITLADFTHDDGGIGTLDNTPIDPYLSTRSYDPLTQGTFFGRLRARNPYYVGRPLRVYTGFFTDPFDFANNFICREYIIENIDGPDAKGQVTIRGKDPLKLVNTDRNLVPPASEIELNAAITAAATSMTVKTGQGALMTHSDQFSYYRIDSEMVYATNIVGDVVTITRAQWGTEADDHEADAGVQKYWGRTTAENVIYLILDLFCCYTTIPTRYFDFAGWMEQAAGYLSGNDLRGGVTEPTAVQTILNEFIEQNLFNLWWDERNSLIRIRSFVPQNVNEPPTGISDEFNLVFNKTSVKDNDAKRATQIWVFYKPANLTEFGDDKDYSRIYIAADTDKEDENAWGEPRIIKVHSRWFFDANRAQAISLATRYLSRYADNPIKVKFVMDVKDGDLDIADNFSLESAIKQNVDGSVLHKKMQVISAQENPYNGYITYEAEGVALLGPYAFVAPNATPNYTSASQAEKDAYGFITQNDGRMTNGDDGYKIQ